MTYKIFILSCFFLFGCEYSDNRLIIVNNTNSDIFIEAYLDTFPDLNKTGSINRYLISIVKAQQDTPIARRNGRNAWPFLIENSKNHMLNLFVFSADTLKKYGDMGLLIEERIYKKYQFSRAFLEKNKWRVEIY